MMHDPSELPREMRSDYPQWMRDEAAEIARVRRREAQHRLAIAVGSLALVALLVGAVWWRFA